MKSTKIIAIFITTILLICSLTACNTKQEAVIEELTQKYTQLEEQYFILNGKYEDLKNGPTATQQKIQIQQLQKDVATIKNNYVEETELDQYKKSNKQKITEIESAIEEVDVKIDFQEKRINERINEVENKIFPRDVELTLDNYKKYVKASIKFSSVDHYNPNLNTCEMTIRFQPISDNIDINVLVVDIKINTEETTKKINGLASFTSDWGTNTGKWELNDHGSGEYTFIGQRYNYDIQQNLIYYGKNTPPAPTILDIDDIFTINEIRGLITINK